MVKTAIRLEVVIVYHGAHLRSSQGAHHCLHVVGLLLVHPENHIFIDQLGYQVELFFSDQWIQLTRRDVWFYEIVLRLNEEIFSCDWSTKHDRCLECFIEKLP